MGGGLFIRFVVRVFCEHLSIAVCGVLPFPVGFEGGRWNLIVSAPDHCFSFYSVFNIKSDNLMLEMDITTQQKCSVRITE